MSDDTRSVPSRTLGTTGPVVAAVALGCSSMSGFTGAGADDEVAAGTIRAAVDQGVDLIDTADFYGLGHNESLIAHALTGVPVTDTCSATSSAVFETPPAPFSEPTAAPRP